MPVADLFPLEVWRQVANATLREEFPLTSCQTIDRPQQLWQNRSYYGVREDLPKVHGYINCEPFLSLSQTSSTFLRLLAPTIYSHIAINHGGHNNNAIGQIALLAQLVKTLERQIVRKTVRKITIDFRILDLDTLGAGLNPWDDIDEGWEHALDLEWENPATRMPDFASVVRSTDELADKLVGLSLEHFEWRGFVRATPKVLEALGQVATLESITFDWNYFLMPYSTPHYKPEPLSLLVQVKAAAVGLGHKRDQYGDREYPYNQKSDLFREEFEELRPGLFGFLTGSNKLRYLFLAAPILYYQESLIPCWAKVHSTVDDALDRVETPSDMEETFPRFGEMSSRDLGDEPYFLAASNFRRLLKQKAEVVSRKMHRGLEAQDVVNLIWEQDELQPWRQWFPKDCAIGEIGEGEIGEERRKILQEVLERWNETASEEVNEMEKKRFSKKSYFLLSPDEEKDPNRVVREDL